MTVDIKRQELYDLVWSTPMMHAAKQFGISGVMLGRICKERNVPKPPRGYWANQEATSAKKIDRFIKPPLPVQPETSQSFNSLIHKEYKDRETARTDVFDPEDLDDPIRSPPPPPTESLEEFRKRIDAIFPALPTPELITARHPFVQKLMDYDVILVALKKRGGWESPNYQDVNGKLRLGWLNYLLICFELLGFEVFLRGKKNFTFYLKLLGHHMEFFFFINEHNSTLIKSKYDGKTKLKTYCFRWEKDSYENSRRATSYYEFEKITMDCIKQILMDLVMKDEKEYRSNVVSNYESRLERRKYVIDRREQEIQRAAEKRRKVIQQLLQNREDLISNAVVSMNHADQIRSLIETIRTKSQSVNQPVRDLDRWVRWATHHANTIDPRHMSVKGFEAWISKFKLKH
jgi:hypothetical protein